MDSALGVRASTSGVDKDNDVRVILIYMSGNSDHLSDSMIRKVVGFCREQEKGVVFVTIVKISEDAGERIRFGLCVQTRTRAVTL